VNFLRLNSDYENKLLQNRGSRIQKKLDKDTRNISSGLKVVTAADDPSGLAVSETMRAQIRGLAQSQRNIQDGMSFLTATEDGLKKTNEDIQRLYEVSVMAMDDSMDVDRRSEIQTEVNELVSSIKQTSDTVQFNTLNLLGSDTKPDKLNNAAIQLGSGPNQAMTIQLMDISPEKLGLANASVDTFEDANKLLIASQNAIKKISGYLNLVGSQYSSLEHSMNSSLALQNNLTKIDSNIRDTDVGKETMELAIDKILSEANLNLNKYTEDQKQQFEKVLFG
jgi:flagellin